MNATMSNAKKAKPIPKTQLGLDHRQKSILKSFVGKSPKPPIDLNHIREWDKYGNN